MALFVGVCGLVSEASCLAIQRAWEHWLGPQRFERKLRRLVELGLVEVVREEPNLDRIVRLTSAGLAHAAGGRHPPLEWARPWDDRWRLAIFDVPELERNLRLQLRRKLRAGGYGYLQHSVWLSPDPIERLQRDWSELTIDVETLTFLVTLPCGKETNAQLVQGAWDFDRINLCYRQYLEILADRPHPRRKATHRRWLEVESRAWLHAVHADPLLPEALHPPGYLGRKAWERRMMLMRNLGAQ